MYFESPSQTRWRYQDIRGIKPNKVGRQLYLNDFCERQFKEIVEERALRGSAVKGEEKLTLLKMLKEQQLEKEGKNTLAIALPTAQTARNICKRLGIKEVHIPSVQTERREQVR